MSGLIHHPLRALPNNGHRFGRRVFIPDDTATRRSTVTSTSTTTTSRTRDHKVKNLHDALRQVLDCLDVRPNVSHERSEASNVVGEERKVDGVLTRKKALRGWPVPCCPTQLVSHVAVGGKFVNGTPQRLRSCTQELFSHT